MVEFQEWLKEAKLYAKEKHWALSKNKKLLKKFYAAGHSPEYAVNEEIGAFYDKANKNKKKGEKMKTVKVKADIIIKLPDDCKDVDKALINLEVALNDNFKSVLQLGNIKYAKKMGVRFHFQSKVEEEN